MLLLTIKKTVIKLKLVNEICGLRMHHLVSSILIAWNFQINVFQGNNFLEFK